MTTFKIKELTLTSPSFPSQWEGITTDNQVIYIHYRFGQLMFSIANNINRAIAREGDDSFSMTKNVGAAWEGELSQKEMLKHMQQMVCFKKCKFKKPNVVFYEFYSSQRPDEFEISTDRTRIVDWETYSVFDMDNFNKFANKPDSVFKMTQAAKIEIGMYGWDKVMNKTKN